MNRQLRRVLGAGLVLPLVALATPALGQTTLNGSGALTYTYQFTDPSGSQNVETAANSYALAVPGQYTLSDTFTTAQSATTQALLGSSGLGSYAFQDTYQFTIASSASGDVLQASLSDAPIFNIANLQFRLYEVATGTAPTVGALPAGATLVANWTSVAAGNVVTATFSDIQAGEYFLDVAGTANGTNGGTYVGQLNLTPTPLPAALPLLTGGLGLLGFVARRRRRT
jgi:hypothetical protein